MLNPQQPNQAPTTPMGVQSDQGQDQQSQPQTQSSDSGQAQQDQGQPQSGNNEADIHAELESRLNSLPPIQQAFISHYLTPETVTLMGIVGGIEVYNYFKQYTDPNKIAVVMPRSNVPQGGQALQDDQNAENADLSNKTAPQAQPAPDQNASQQQEAPSNTGSPPQQ